MEIKKTLILDSSEPLSKALPHLAESPAVIVTKGGRYYGMIDHRSATKGIKNAKAMKCESVIVKPPVIWRSAGVLNLISAFLLGHFKALPVVDEGHTPLGVTTRVELLKEMRDGQLVPKGRVSDFMNTPVFSIDEGQTISDAKATMKERDARRLVVTRKGKPLGVVSTFDIGIWKGQNMGGGRKDIHISEKINIDEMPISGFLRPDIIVVEESTPVDEAVDKMIKREVSGVVITSGNKAVGVLSALDIFKRVEEIAREGTEIHISGLGEDTKHQFSHIRDKIGHVVDKFGKAFNIRNVAVRVKEEKSTFTVNVNFDTDEGHIALRGERGTLKETVDELAEEVDKVLRRKKEKRRIKPRASRYGGTSGTNYKRRGKE